MKKFLKVFGIIILIAGAIGGTCLVFFMNIKNNTSSFNALVDYTYSANITMFNADLRKVDNSLDTDTRFEIIIASNRNLNEMTKLLTAHIIDDTKIDNIKIANKLGTIKQKKLIIDEEIEEYLYKATSPYVDRHIEVNKLYNLMSKYLIDFADIVFSINQEIEKLEIDRTVSSQFSIIDLYTRTINRAFNDIEVISANGWEIAKYTAELKILNDNIQIENTEFKYDKFSVNNNKFVEFYENCDKDTFVNDLTTNINSVTIINDGSTNIQKATYYFKKLLSI